ncbi:MAG: hypothetical protein RIR97_99 [Pseudomonadota bacterium]
MTPDDMPDTEEVRGEKNVFHKKDIALLDAMPSSKSARGARLKPMRRRGIVYGLARMVMAGLMLAMVGAGVFVVLIERGFFDDSLKDYARQALNTALPPNFKSEFGSAGIRLGKDGHLAIEARNVTITDTRTNRPVMESSAIEMALLPLSVLKGQVAISSVDIKSMRLDSSAFSGGVPLDMAKFRIADMPDYLDQFYARTEEAFSVIAKGGTQSLRIEDTGFILSDERGRPIDVRISSFTFTRNLSGNITAQGTVKLDEKPTDVSLNISFLDEKLSAMTMVVQNADVTPLFLGRNLAGLKRQGFEGKISLDATLKRGVGAQEPEFSLLAKTAGSTFFASGERQEITEGNLNLNYDFAQKRFLLDPSELVFGKTKLPLEAAVSDRIVSETNPDPGLKISVFSSNGLADVALSGEAPLPFDFAAEADLTPAKQTLVFNKLHLTTPSGEMVGSAAIRFGGLSPEISLAAESASLKTQVIKQIWPYWIAPKVRKWTLANIFGGEIRNASIETFIPRDRLYLAAGHMDLDENQLKLAFDADDMRLNLPGELPPLRNVSGRLELKGPKVSVAIGAGNVFLASGRTATVSQSSFAMANSRVRPQLADVSLKLAGKLDAIAELASLKPVNALGNFDFQPADFSGTANATIEATFGLVKAQNPPPTVWKAALDLKDAALAKPLSGHQMSAFNGIARIDPDGAALDGKGQIDGLDVKIAATLPVGSASSVKRAVTVSGTLDSKALAKLVPGLSRQVQGSMGVELLQSDGNEQSITLDLSRTTLLVPWIGWSKGNGIAAKASFKMQTVDGVTQIRDLDLSGDGFGTKGKLEFGKQGLISAALSSVKLSASDNFSLTLKRKNEDYRAAVTGKSLDLRPILAMMKAQSASSGTDTSNLQVTVDVDRATGFQNETISNLKADYGSNSGSLTRLDLSGISESGQAVVAKLAADGDGKSVRLTAGDAGALARFADVYKNMQNGLLNMQLKQRAPGFWVGSIDIRKFHLSNEDRLQTIVSTPAGENGKSLNQAVKKDIDVRSEKFSRGLAGLIIKNGVIQIDNGVVRGEQVGATFQGTVRDANGQTDMTGTFMPAYGLNRLFAELPVIGLILGNGRDRGLLGITFKLSGPFEKPQLTINPLSLIAPGVFRSIFEFQ